MVETRLQSVIRVAVSCWQRRKTLQIFQFVWFDRPTSERETREMHSALTANSVAGHPQFERSRAFLAAGSAAIAP